MKYNTFTTGFEILTVYRTGTTGNRAAGFIFSKAQRFLVIQTTFHGKYITLPAVKCQRSSGKKNKNFRQVKNEDHKRASRQVILFD